MQRTAISKLGAGRTLLRVRGHRERERRVRSWRLHLMAVVLVACVGLAACTAANASDPARRSGTVVVHADEVVARFDPRLLGTNVPAWLSPQIVASDAFRVVTEALGTTVLRMPGGSWSDSYDWLGCEMGTPNACQSGAMRPSDYVGLLGSTHLQGMWTVSFNGTAQEAAAAVAFFNGDVDDDRPIGRDRNSRDWETVGHWAQLRAQNGHPNPVGIQYWEVGNEIFGAVRGARGSCASWGWENVWTCDGTDYVQGDEAHDGFLDFRDAMRSVDSTIEVGAVGVGARGEWSDWDDKVMDGAGSDIDFYVVHHYGANTDLKASKLLGLPSRQWPDITDEVESGYADHGIDPATPITITEHNLIATQDGDNQQFMAKALNAFYLADTIGQMATNGVTMANQWNLANGRAPNGTDYGLVDAQTLQRSPAYYALALWSRVGDELLQVDTDGLDRVQVFGARDANGELQLMVIKFIRVGHRRDGVGGRTAQCSLGDGRRRPGSLARVDECHVERLSDAE